MNFPNLLGILSKVFFDKIEKNSSSLKISFLVTVLSAKTSLDPFLDSFLLQIVDPKDVYHLYLHNPTMDLSLSLS